MTATLKPCPFCGGEPHDETFHTEGGGYAVWCVGCDAIGPEKPSEEDAVEAWNRRPGEDDAAFDAWAGESAAYSRDD